MQTNLWNLEPRREKGGRPEHSIATAFMAPSPENRAMATIDGTDMPAEQQNPGKHQKHHRKEGEREGHQFFPLARQSSILSLTLEEVQNTVCEPGKSFGSMNLDEFLTNIWTVDEGNAMGGVRTAQDPSGGADLTAADTGQPPLYRQGSLSLPTPLCQKTVDEVWSEIHRDQQQASHGHPNDHRHQRYSSSGNTPRQPTFGEMTLEDFLIKAGVVREGGHGSPCASPPQPVVDQDSLRHHQPHQVQGQYGLSGYPVENEQPGYSHVMGMGYGDHPNPAGATADGVYHQQQGGGVVTSIGNGYGEGGGVVGYGVGMGNGYEAQQPQQVGAGSPVRPLSPDGLGGSNNPTGRWGAVLGGGGTELRGGVAGVGGCGSGRKRIMDGVVEKVVERRQRRMIKNRESAARSRARKQAHTVELEAELNQLKEENARLQEEQRRLAARRRQMLLLESMAQQSRTNERNAHVMMRRSTSCVW